MTLFYSCMHAGQNPIQPPVIEDLDVYQGGFQLSIQDPNTTNDTNNIRITRYEITVEYTGPCDPRSFPLFYQAQVNLQTRNLTCSSYPCYSYFSVWPSSDYKVNVTAFVGDISGPTTSLKIQTLSTSEWWITDWPLIHVELLLLHTNIIVYVHCVIKYMWVLFFNFI